MRLTAFRLVQSREIKMTFTRFPRKEKNDDWSLGAYMIPSEAIAMCVGCIMWLKPGSKVYKELKYNHAGQEEIEVTYPDTDEMKSFFIPLASFSSFTEIVSYTFEEYSI